MSVVVRAVLDIAGHIGAQISHTTNHILPPKQRERALESLRAFSVRNPKLASFLAAQTALAGLPIVLFLTFAIATLVVSLVACILLGIITALVFTLFTTAFALLFVVPVAFIGSCTASIAFLWGLIGYLVLRRINGGETPGQPGSKVGDVMSELTDRRSCHQVDRADTDAQQERLAVDSPYDKKLPMGSESEHGCHEPRGGSPPRRPYRQTNGSGHSAEAREEIEEGGARGASVRTRHVSQDTRNGPGTLLSTYDPAVERVTDWKSEFQHEAITA